MAKRISKKLLMGLGSVVTFGAVGTVSGFGVKSIIDSVNEKNLLNNQINKLSEADFDRAPDYNKATREMFFDTTDLKSFHFGNVQRGQTITPYGWLGVFEQPNSISRKIALTGWNGEILWVNDDYVNQGSNLEFNVYDMKYDFNTDLVFVARTSSKNGLINDNKSVAKITIDVLDANSGIKKQSVAFNQTAAWNVLSGAYIDSNDNNHLERSKNLYSLDVVSNGTNAVVLSWTPNFLQLTSRRDNFTGIWDNTKNRIMPMYDLISNNAYSAVVTNLNFIKNTTDGTVSTSNVPRLNIRDADSIQNTLQPGWFVDSDLEYLHNFSLITNPFITTNAGKLMVHLLVANKHDATSQSKVYHQAVEFDPNGKYIKEVTENITSKIPIFKDTTWIISKDWSSNFINANLKINRNMFDNNSIVFAFPYAAGGNPRVPIFNVAQLLINPSDGKIDWTANKGAKKSMVLPMGKDIVDYWQKNNGSYASNNTLNKIYPFPYGNHNNLNHNYNRLITVSPFDNTIVYAAKPNLTSSIFDATNNNQDKWAGFWLGTVSKSTPYRPFIVYNDGTLGQNMDPKMTTVNDLYTYGPTFDLKSLTGQSLNLYFNQTGTGRNDTYSNNGFLSSKIGLLDDVLAKDSPGNIWFRNVANPTSGKPLDKMGSVLNSKSYSTLIHSRANLETWYPRTWQNIEVAGNLFSSNYQINASVSDSTRAVANSFNTTLNEAGFFNTNKSVDLVSNWLDKDKKAPNNYNRLLVKRPEIRVRGESIQNKLPVETTYNFSNTTFLTSNPWISPMNATMKDNLKFKSRQDLPTASYQIFSSWKEQFRMSSFGSDTSNISPRMETTNNFSSPAWIDKRGPNSAKAAFGLSNNAVAQKNKLPLRLMLKIVKPSNPPTWFNKIPNNLFDLYPVEAVNNNETTFSTVLQKFVDEKTKLLNTGDSNETKAVGLGNLKIEAYLGLNPAYLDNPDYTIYTKSGGTKIIVDKSTSQRIIYKDGYSGNRAIYDQSQIEYTNFNKGGFGNDVKPVIQESWNTTINPSNKFNVKVKTSNLKDELVRKSQQDQTLFTFDYEAGNTNLIITPKDANWLRPRLLNFQRMINMQARFEYQTNNSSWKTLTTTSDADMKSKWTSNANTFKLPTSGVTGITKLRIKLIPMNDTNSFVSFSDYVNTDNKFISAAQDLGTRRIDVNKEWFNQVNLENTSNNLASLSVADFTNFENSIFQKSNAIKANSSLRNEVKLQYKWTDNKWYDATTIQPLIVAKLRDFNGSDQGVFSLWNGTAGMKISAKFVKANSTSNIQFVSANGSSIGENDLTGYVKSTIKTEINLSPYILELQSALITAAAGATPGTFQGSSIQFPSKQGSSGSAQFAGKTWDEIKTILSNVGVAPQFKQYQLNSKNWSSWISDINSINSYDPSNPQIKIGFKNTNSNIKLLGPSGTSTAEINDNSDYSLSLSLPKLVKLPDPIKINQMIQQFNAQNIFGGNTYQLEVSANLDNGKNIFISGLKEASISGSNANGYDNLSTQLEFKFKLGNSEWKEANDLKAFLLTQNTDQNSNALKLKVNIKSVQNQKPEFILEQSLADKEFELLPDNNKNIKKWLHGTEFENELEKNNISVTGSKSNLTYTLNGPLAKFVKPDGKYSEKQLRLQYQLIDLNGQANTNWTDGYMPSKVQSNINKIKVRIVWDKTVATNNQIYIYGPEKNQNQKESTIDLSKIATLIQINPNWFDEVAVVDQRTDTKSLTQQTIQAWENKIYGKIPEIVVNPELKKKLIIKYEFINHRDLTSSTLLNAINNVELAKYDSQEHHGIVKLYDKNAANSAQSGYKIKAIFQKLQDNDSTIQFIDSNGAVIDGEQNKSKRTGIVNATNITTTINLTDWINNLMNALTIVRTNNAGTIPQNGLEPPMLTGPANSKLFASQSFTNIENWLKAAQINFLWRKEETGNNWKQGTAAITEYDATKKKLWFALDNQSTNLILVLGNTKPTLNPGDNNKNNPIEVKLDAPAIINVKPIQLGAFGQYFSGNTKEFNVNEAEITKKLNEIKTTLGTGFENAPLTIMVQVGNEAFYDYKKVKSELFKLSDDVANGIVVAKFAIDTTASNKDKFQIITGGDGNQQIIDDNGTIKVYINNKNIFEDLQATTVSGSSKDLRLEWQKGISINSSNGTLTATGRGKGLKIEYTFNKNLEGKETDPTSASAADINQKWVPVQPTTFQPGVDNNLFIRIRLIDPTKYTYENINKKITIDLTKLKSIILLDPAWLNKEVSQNNIDINNFGLQQINDYETKVFNAMTINNNLKDKVEIKYDFNGNQNVDKTKLINLITSYKTNNTSNPNLGILQLANGTETTGNGYLSEKIIAKFAIKDQFNSSYEIEIKQGADNAYQLDTSKVITTIDFSKVLTWLQGLKVPFESNKINIPPVNAGNNEQYFNNQPWTKVEQTLKGFGIIIEYRKMMNLNQGAEEGWSELSSSIDGYNEAIGKFQIRFKTDGVKSKNIKFKTTSSETVDGTNANVKSKAYDVNLKVKLMVQINQQYTDAFKNTQNVVSGNTKYLNILASAENQMITNIKTANQTNNPAFNTLDLKVEYQIGNDKNGVWKTRDNFIQDLKNSNNDQTTNEVSFRFAITDAQKGEFGVDQRVYTLSEQKSATAPDIKIRYYINSGDWENKANQIQITGTSDRLDWNLNTIFNGVLNEESDGKVYLRTNAGQAIQVFFTTNAGADYNNPSQTSDSLNDLATKWVSKKPTAINASTQNLKIKLVSANSGFIYGPAYNENNVTPTAQAHNVTINIQKVLYVDKQWFKPELVSTAMDISALQKNYFDQWEANVYKQLAAKNKVDNTIARKIKIKYFFDDEPNSKVESTEFINKITQLRTEFNNNDLGILQLWDGQRGKKINAIFESGDTQYIIRVEGTNGEPPSNLIQAEINTSKIFTTVSMSEYIQVLKTDKTTVELNPAAGVGKINSFSPPSGKNPNGIFDRKNYDEIATRLKAIGIKIEFSKDKNNWLQKEQIKDYDIQTNALFLKFTVQSSSVKLQLDKTTQIENNQDSTKMEIKLPLQVPKYIVIDSSKNYWQLTNQFNFNGNTKRIEFDEAKINQFIHEIKTDNVNAGNDQEYNNAPLQIKFQVGTGSEFTEISKLKEYLNKQPDDLPDREIKFKFALQDGTDTNQWKIQNENAEYQFLGDQDPKNNVKLYINDKGVFGQLQAMNITGTSDALKWNWPPLVQSAIDETTGVLNPPVFGLSFGKGLKFEFTFKDNPDLNGPLGNNSETDWVAAVPKQYDANKGFTNVYLRIKLTQENYYTYENINKLVTISLNNVNQKIILKTVWLEKQFNGGQPLTLENLSLAKIQEYEQAVKHNAQNDGINQTLLGKFNIKYQFNFTNSIDGAKLVDANNLLKEIEKYKTNNGQPSLGILQLWNNASGVKIAAKFDDANPNDKYEISVTDKPDYKILNTENIITAIDFTSVLDWLKKLEVPINEGTNNAITQLLIPSVESTIQYFGSKSWTEVESALALFGITIQYSNNTGDPENWGSITSVNKYDPKKPSFKIKFKTDGAKSKNIKFKLANNQELNGSQPSESPALIINIKARLLVEIPNNLLTIFETNANITGDTKNIKIETAQQAESNLISGIIDHNKQFDPRYGNLVGKLEIQYLLKKETPNNNDNQWKTLTDFKNYLAGLNQDQTTNKIWFKIVLKDKVTFNINSDDEQPKVLSDHKAPTDPDIKIKYYINADNWETNASKIKVSGTSDNLRWNFADIFTSSKVTERDEKVYLRNDAGEAIQVFFTTNASLDYNNTQISDSLNDLATKWVSKKPIAINAATNVLKIKLVSNTGFVYGPAEAGAKPPAQAHNVTINIQKVLYVDKEWFKAELVSTAMDISSLQKNHLNQWESSIYTKLATLNRVDDAIARKINIKYFFDSNKNEKFNSDQLIQKINQLRTDYSNTDLGILQLWDGQRGKKLNAIFESGNNQYVIRVQGNQNDPNEDQISNQLNTEKIFTTVSMVEYIGVLTKDKTRVELNGVGGPGKINSFTPPDGKTNPVNGIFHGKTYQEISDRLKAIGIKIEFSKDNKTNWLPKEQIKEYDIQLNSLYLKFTVETSSIKLQLEKATQIGIGQDSGKIEIRLPLQVPKYIVISNTKPYWGLTNDFAFSGTTKNIEFNLEKIKEFLNEIKKDNAASGNDQEYNNAPLEIKFQVGTGSEFTEISKLKEYLNKQPDDLPDRTIKFKFGLTNGTNPDDWQIQNENAEYQFLDDKSPKNKVKLYINDKGVFDQLKAMVISGTNDAMEWNWPDLVQPPVLNENTGVLNPDVVINKNFGKGLRLEFTFNKNYQNAQLGQNPETDWVSKVPKQYDANKGFTNVYLRIKLTDDTYYTYENIDKPIALSLEKVGEKILLKTAWLNKQFNNGAELDLGNLTAEKINEYEHEIKKAAELDGLDSSLLNKFNIKYQFNFTTQVEQNKLVDATGLVSAIKEYQTNKDPIPFGILQLWNQTTGIKIIAKFVDANENDKYQIEVKDQPDYHILDTTNISTTIDFTKVITWLTTTKKLVVVTGSSQAATLSIPNVDASNDGTFNKKEWSKVEETLKRLGITVQYRKMLQPTLPNDENDWQDDLSLVKEYDENIGKIQIRFKFNNNNAKNIKFKTGDNKTYDGKVDSTTLPFELSLNIKLKINVKSNIVETNFINKNDVITGNTKYLKIKSEYETKMIDEIKKDNATSNNEFNNANLIVKYKLDKQTDWKTRQEFINNLKANNNDQKSNKVLFKFEVTNNDEFEVDGKEWVLFDPDSEINRNNWKVKLFINNGSWETQASGVNVTGKTSGINWDWNGLNVKDQNGKVGTDGLQVEFSAKNGANYSDADAVETGDLKTQWVLTKPTTLDATIQNLYIRIKAKAGYIYGPAYNDNENSITASAKAHKVNLEIKREILVRPIDLLTSLTLNSGGFVNDITQSDLEKFVTDGLGKIQPPDLQQHVTVKFSFNRKTNLTATTLYNEIQNIIQNNNGSYYGILQLWNSISGEKIEAYYDLINPGGEYELITNDGTPANQKQVVITGHIETKIKLIDIVSDLKTKKIRFEPVANKNKRDLITIKNWIMPETKSGSEPLNSLSWELFENRLKEVGVLIKARIVNNPDNPQASDWKSLSDLKQYNDRTLQLALRFEIESKKGDNIVLSVNNDGDVNSTTQTLPEFKINIKAPATVTVNPAHLSTFTTTYKIGGNTKNIELDENAEKVLIEAIYNENIVINNQVFKDLKDRLSIEYYLGKKPNEPNTEWLKREEFINSLADNNTDQTTNEIWFRLAVTNPAGDDVQTFNIDQTSQKLNEERIDDSAKVKIFINDNGLEARAKALKAIGSTDDFEIPQLNQFNSLIPKGLKAQWSNVADPKTDQEWTDKPPTTLNPDKNLWVRFKSESGYVYEKALKTNDDKYTQYSDKYPINTEGLKVILKVQKEWLEKIKITNNTNNPNIDETAATAEIDKILPTGKPDLIELQYHIKGSGDWLKKDQFMEKLKNLKGAKDTTNFILKREEIEVRYAIKTGEDEYSLNINGVNITENNQNQYYVQLVDDNQKRNEAFEGYINVDLLTEFKKDNFRIQGSTTRPQFLVTNRKKIESYFAPYASDQLFDIIYSTDYDANKNEWTWDETKSILKNGKLIGETDLIGQTTIKPDKKFALKFISKQKTKYGVYKDSKKQDDGYILDLSENVKITIEIENPFTKNNKTLGLWTRDDNKQGKYFQGEGGFKIVVANKNDFSIDSSNGTVQSAQEFLKTSGLADNEKEALEFVYHIFGANPTKDEIDRIQKTINDHKSDDWKQFNSTTKNNGDWSGDLKLKVGDYVAVAIRVKKQYSEGDNAFVLKNNDYSMILPTMPDQSGNMKKPGRISGYKVKTDAVKLDESSVTLLSMINPELPPLDGWAWLSKLNLQADEKGNYLGVDLDLQLYNQFYKKNGTDQIWISGSGAKLVKRETTSDNSDLVDTNKTYKDGSNQDITDENGNPIKIYKTKQNRLSNPKKENKVTKNKLLENLGNGAFRLDVNQSDSIEQGKLSLFRNQDVDLKLVASKGEGTKDLPDFYLDKDNQTIPLKNIISPKIKYPIENENKITYSWNYEDFSIDTIQYDPVNNNNKPEDGAAKIKTIFKLFKQRGDSENKETITGDTTDQAVQALEESLKKDFDDQLKFQVVYSKNNGGETVEDTNNIYKFTTLKNKDRISLKIVAKDEDLYYVEAPRPLIINVNGLTEAAPTRDKLQHLRVEQNGLIDGQGSFKVLVSNPDNPGEDERAILKGWKFMIRVWDKDHDDKGEKQIKINWTDDQALIKGLSNGDKVEWKLVSEDGNPVKDAYYNTIALQHTTDPNNGKITYNFGEVNYPKGEGAYNVVNQGIGAYPEIDQYPEKSGFVISGLKDKFEIFKIDKSAFEKVLAQLQPTYVGINTQGTIRFDQKYFEQEYWVNTKGDIYTQAEKPQLFKDNLDQEIIEIKLIDFLKQVTFYTHDPVIANYQGGFKFSGNDININNHLTNGDQMWATFDTTGVNDVNANINNTLSSLTTRLNDVSGLKDIIDPMSPLWYVLMALAGIATLGTAALIAFLVARHKKLKGKN